MRIAIDARAYFQRTGIARYTRGLVSALAEQGGGHEFLLLISDHHRPEEVPLPSHMTAQVSHAPWLGGVDERRVLEGEALAWRADLFHAIFPPITLEHVPSVVTVFDVTPLTHPQLHQDVVRVAFTDAWNHLRATGTRLAAVSHATRDAMLGTGAGDADPDPAVIGIGLSAPFDSPAPEDEPSGTRDGVLFVGTLEPRKNVSVVIEAVRLLAQQGYPVALTLAGKIGWGDQTWLASLVEAGGIRCAGRVSDEELLALYRQSALLVCPSEVEGFGLPVLEAMAQGVVPIVSNTPALLELVGAPQFGVEIRASAISAAIRFWLSNAPARVAAAQRLRERARNHSWEHIVGAWLTLYSETHAA